MMGVRKIESLNHRIIESVRAVGQASSRIESAMIRSFNLLGHASAWPNLYSCSIPVPLFLFLPRLLAAALARQRLFYALFLAGLKIEGVTLHFLDDVFLLHFAFEAPQRIFQRLAFLQSNFCQRNYTPKLVPVRPVS